MSTQFFVDEVSVFPSGKIALAGRAVGALVVVGQRGCAQTPFGQLRIEVVSIGIVNSTRVKPMMQALQIKLLEGDVNSLKGSMFVFE